MGQMTRREFLRGFSIFAGYPLIYRWLDILAQKINSPAAATNIYVAKNGNPVSNVQRVIGLAGGITQFVNYDDVVVIKPNGQWENQGYTHTQAIKALIDIILARPGGFGGEIILMEHVHRSASETLAASYCWNMSTGKRVNNWAAMNYNELVADYHARGILNVTANPLLESGDGNYAVVTGPAQVTASGQGWVHADYTPAANSRKVTLSYPILRSAYSNKLIDLKNGVWQNGGYTSQQVKLVFMPTLNNHGSFNAEDYAGPTSALKTHIGIVDFGNLSSGATSLHGVGYNSPTSPAAMGEAVGQLITQLIHPVFYLTVAEYTGYRSRTDITAAQTRTVGLCADPVTLDYWMCKYVMYPCATSQSFMNPDNNANLRKALLGCQSKGVGTVNEAEMLVHLSDIATDKKVHLPVIRR